MIDRVLKLPPLDGGETLPGRRAARGAGARRLRDRVWERLAGTAAQLAAAAEAELQALPALFEELMSLPGEPRRAAVEREERFWTYALAQELSRAACGLLPAEPGEALVLGELARGILLRLPAGRYPEGMLHELAAEVWQGLAEAHRHWGDLPAANRALRQAERVATGEGLGPHVRAAFCLALGRLRWDEGRPEEALAALERSARLWQSLEDFDAECEALTEMGWIALAVGDLEEAREQLEIATRLAKPERTPGLALRAYHGLALACAELGRRLKAEAVLAAARELYPLLPGSVDRLRSAWMEARVAAACGRTEEAAARLAEVVEGWLAEEEPYDAAIALLELAALAAEGARSVSAEQLARLAAPLTEPRVLPPAARTVFAFAWRFSTRADLLAEAAEHLERCRRNPGLRCRPRQESSHLELAWDQGVPENLEVTVERAGWLPLPPQVSSLLLLLPGDAVLLDSGPASLRLEPCREWVRGLGALPAGRWAQALAELRQGAWTLVTPGGALLLPPELLSLEPGETVVLQLQERGGSYRLFAFKDEPAPKEAA